MRRVQCSHGSSRTYKDASRLFGAVKLSPQLATSAVECLKALFWARYCFCCIPPAYTRLFNVTVCSTTAMQMILKYTGAALRATQGHLEL